MVTVYKKIENIQSPKLLEATLMSEEEWEACKDYIPQVPNLTNNWYLRTAYDDNQIGFVDEGNMELGQTYPDYMEFGGIWYGIGIRPMIRIESLGLSEEVALLPGDKMRIGYDNFTVVSENILLLDDYINFDGETEEYSVFDEETNIYENSAAKELVDKWFESVKRRI